MKYKLLNEIKDLLNKSSIKSYEIILNATFTEYQREIERKTRIESKALSYATIVSIIMATSLVVGAYILPSILVPLVMYFYLCSLSITTFFSLSTIYYTIPAFKLRILTNIKVHNIEYLWHEDDSATTAGTVYQTLKNSIDENQIYNKKLAEIIELSYILLRISFTSLIIQVLLSFIIMYGRLING